jgi:O-antigen/teichoic acid export membrane protein
MCVRSTLKIESNSTGPGTLRERLSSTLINGLWSTAGNATLRLTQLILGVMLARTLGAEVLGEYSLFYTIAVAGSAVLGLGMTTAINRECAAWRVQEVLHPRHLLLVALTWCVIAAAIISVVWHVIPLQSLLFWLPVARLSIWGPELMTAALGLAAGAIFLSAFAGLGNFRGYFWAATIQAAVLAVAVGLYIGSVSQRGITPFVAIAFATSSLFSGMLFYRSTTMPPLHVPLQRATKTLFEIALPSYLSAIFFMPIASLAVLLLGGEGGASDVQVAVYTTAFQWQGLVLFLPNALSAVLLQMMTRLSLQGRSSDLRGDLRIQLFVVAILASVVALSIGALGPLLEILYAKALPNFRRVLWLMVGAGALFSVANVLAIYFVVRKLVWAGFALTVIWATSFMGFALLFIQEGAMGLAVANLAAHAIHLACTGLTVVWFLGRKH